MPRTGTFLVTAADEASAVLREVESGQVHTLAEHPDLGAGEVLSATLIEADPLGATWTIEAVDDRYRVSVECVDEPPAAREREAAPADPSEVATLSTPETTVHVLAVPPEETERAAADVLDDEATLERAARLGSDRVTVRARSGVVSVRYE